MTSHPTVRLIHACHPPAHPPPGLPEAVNRSIDIVSKEPADGAPTTDFAALLRAMPANCDYTIDKTPAAKVAA